MRTVIRRHRPLFLLLVLLANSSAAERASLPRAEAERERAAKLHREFDAEGFSELSEASRRLDLDAIDYDLLSAATFHETNRKRAGHGLPSLAYNPELVDAARIQARGMARSGTVSHQHPDAALRTLADRMEHVGLQPAFSAENVAMSFSIEYDPGRPVVPREEDGRQVFSYEAEGDPIPPHTYLSYAESLLDQWMDSPGHRENILREEPEQLGTGHEHATNEAGMDVFYSVQVFFTELDVPPGAEVIRR